MRHGPRPIPALILSAAALSALTGATAPSSTSVTVNITDLRNTKGVVRACLTTQVKDFPKCHGVANAQKVVHDAAATLTIKFDNVTPGTYAIAVLHDENNNGKVDRALLMMPKEGYGFSRDAKVVMGPPKFKAAAFEVGAEPQTQAIKMRYML